MLIYLSLFRYAYPWSRDTKVKTEPNRDRGGPRSRPRPNSDVDLMVCQKLDRDRDRPTLARMMNIFQFFQSLFSKPYQEWRIVGRPCSPWICSEPLVLIPVDVYGHATNVKLYSTQKHGRRLISIRNRDRYRVINRLRWFDSIKIENDAQMQAVSAKKNRFLIHNKANKKLEKKEF